MKAVKNMKTPERIKAVIEWILILVALCSVLFTILAVTTFDKNDRAIFGFRAYVCMSDSMKATDFEAGDLLIVKEVDPSLLQVGDIIAYISEDEESLGKTITHKIRTIRKSGNQSVFIAYGTTTGINDSLPVSHDQVLGKYLFRIAGVGELFLFMQTLPGYLLCIFLPFAILLAFRIYGSVKLQKAYNLAKKTEEQEEYEEGGREHE